MCSIWSTSFYHLTQKNITFNNKVKFLLVLSSWKRNHEILSFILYGKKKTSS